MIGSVAGGVCQTVHSRGEAEVITTLTGREHLYACLSDGERATVLDGGSAVVMALPPGHDELDPTHWDRAYVDLHGLWIADDEPGYVRDVAGWTIGRSPVNTQAVYVRADTDIHTKAFWHATALRELPIPAERSSDGKTGWHSQENYVCTHDHDSRDKADACARRLAAALRRETVPTWARER